jgi:hypothetical protein
MSINQDQSHVAHTIAKYFEMHRSKKNLLMLILKEQNKEKMLPEQLGLIKIKGANIMSD